MDAEKLKKNSRKLLRDGRGGRKNTFTAGNEHHPGACPGTRERPGNRYLPRVFGTGGRRVAPGSPGDRANRNSEAGRPADLDW